MRMELKVKNEIYKGLTEYTHFVHIKFLEFTTQYLSNCVLRKFPNKPRVNNEPIQETDELEINENFHPPTSSQMFPYLNVKMTCGLLLWPQLS